MADERSLASQIDGANYDGTPEGNRYDLTRELARAQTPQARAVLLQTLAQMNGAPAPPVKVAKNMRDGFPELDGVDPSTLPSGPGAAPDGPAPFTLSDFLGGNKTGAAPAPSVPAAPAAAPASLNDFLDNMPAPPAPPPHATVMDRIKDVGIGLLQGAIQVPQGALGLIDAVTGGQVGKTLENSDGSIGFRPDDALNYLNTLKSDSLQKATQTVQDAGKGQPGDDQGFMAQLGRTGLAALKNPSVIADSIWQSIPSIMAGGAVSRGLLWGVLSTAEKAAIVALPEAQQAAAIAAASPRLAGFAGGIGEGVTTAGNQVEQIRTDEHNPNRLLTPEQSALGIGSGAVTGIIGALTGKLAQKVGLEQAENLMAGVKADPKQMGMLKGLAGAAATEGTQEFFQSANEQMAQNLATGQPLMDGVAQQAVLGSAAGIAMGTGSHGFFHGGHTTDEAAHAASDQAMSDIAAAPDVDSAIDAFQKTYVPPTVPGGFDADAAMARMERANANDQNMLRDRTGLGSPEVTGTPGAPINTPDPDSVSGSTSIDAAIQQATASVPTPDLGGAQRFQADLSGFPPTAPATTPSSITDARTAAQGTPTTAPERIQAKVPESFQDRLSVVRDQLADSRVRQQIRDTSGSTALHDALYLSGAADNAELPGQTSDNMLAHAERLINNAGVQPLARVTQANVKAQSLADKRAATQAKIDEQNKTKETVPLHPDNQARLDAASVPGMGLKERAAASSQRQKAALLTGNAVVNEEGLREPLPAVSRETVDEAAHVAAPSPQNSLEEPTQAQKEAGNYQKGHVNVSGLDISVENPEGSTRSGVGPDGKAWESKLQHHYGYIRGTIGQDGEHIDTFIKPGTALDHGGPVFVVDQIHPHNGQPDEHKVMLGFDSKEEAQAAYQANYAKGWKGLQSITETPLDGFKQWLATGDTTKPFHAPTLAERAQIMRDRNAESSNVETVPSAPQANANKAVEKDEGKPASPVTVTGNETVTEAPEEPQVGDLGPLTKHTTPKGKELFGYVRNMPLDEAKTIDPFAFKKDGGVFIRERHGDALEAHEKANPVTEVEKPASEVQKPASNAGETASTGAESGSEQKSLKERVEAMKERIAAQQEPKPLATLTTHLVDVIQRGDMPKDNPALRKIVAEFDGKPVNQARMKEAQETLESAIVQEARRKVGAVDSKDPRAQFERLLALYQSQPNLNVRTSSSIENQAYSTPAPLALLAAKLAEVNHSTTVLEPTAGTGMLLITADPNKVIANEIDPMRRDLLKEQGFAKVTDRDATSPVTAIKVDRVMANPPFGPLDKKVKVDGYTFGQIDHLISAQALAQMKDDGKATIIIGANKVAGGLSNQDLIFFNWLYGNYNVTSHFEVDGGLYSRQGASWPVRVITVQGREKSARISPEAGVIQRAATWEDVYDKYQQGLATGRAGRGLQTAPVGSTSAGPDDASAVREPADIKDSGIDGPGAPGSATGDANVPGQRAGTVVDSGKLPAQPVGERSGAERPGDAVDRANRLDRDASGPGGLQPAGNPRTLGVRADALAPADNEFQAPYTPRSGRKDTGVLIPVNMQQPTQDALSRLEDAVGDIDEYARKQLGYESVDALHEALMGLQVDSVASAIHQLSLGKGTIIADQTGIGKGRQAAAIIRWAVKQGRVPIFASVKPSLFTDMYGDLHDIGTDDVNPLILNSTESIKGQNDEKLFANKPAAHRGVLQKVADTGMLPEGSNALFMTYSQINVANVQRQVVQALANRAIFVLDESHNAGGESNTGSFMKEMLDLGKGVVYLSATFAKRPDNMPLYFKTDMGEAVADDNTLMAAMEAGGLPLQTVVSNNLVKAGQMFRRERSYDGVKIDTVIDTENRALHETQSDAATEALRAITGADRMFHEVFFKSLQKEMAKEGSRMLDNAGNQAQTSVDRTQFSSVVHNFVRQMLLGLEADKAADRAIAALQRGQKPLIALENTMGSFLDGYATDNRINVGDSLGNFDYRNVLGRALDRTRYYTKQLPNGDKVKVNVPLSALHGATLEAYVRAQEVIDNLKLDIPVSPIDWMRDRLTKAGFSVAEITGRNLMVDYTDPKKPVLSQMNPLEQTDKVRTTRQFNSGKLDSIILNVAGSTGISLHASEKFTDQRQRLMIVAQAAQDINVFMQMLGRIHRTGQVTLPGYELLNADLPAVKRPTAVLSGKMKSLNANTSSNTESATSVKAFDMLNKYGDRVVSDYLNDNPKLRIELGFGVEASSDVESESEEATADIARKMTGRLALLPVAQQRSVYADLEAQYEATIDYLNKTNQNDLEPRTFDFDARETASQVLFEGTNPATPFGQDAIYNEYSIKAQGKPPTAAEVRSQMAENLGKHPGGDAHAAELVSTLKAQMPRFMSGLNEQQQAQADATRAKAVAFMQQNRIGAPLRVEINGEPYQAVVTNLRSTHVESGNPFSMSKIQVTLALNGSLRSITVPATRFASIETSRAGGNIEQMFKPDPYATERQTAKIVTGNLLGAYGELKDTKTSIISFTKADGTTEQGIMLPKSFTLARNTQGDYRLPNGEAAALFLRQSVNKDIGKFGISTRDGLVRVTPTGTGIEIRVPASKAKGGKFFLDEGLRAVAGDFVSQGNKYMVATVDRNDAPAALDALMKKQALYTLPSMAGEAKSIIGETNTKTGTGTLSKSITNPDRSASMATAMNPNAPGMGRASSAAQLLAEKGSAPWVREVAATLAPFIGADTQITYLKTGDKVSLPSHVAQTFRNPGIFGLSDIDPVTGQGAMYLKYNDQNPVGESDMLHELLHEATQRALSVTKSATIRAELESIRAVLGRTFDQVLTSPNSNEQARNDAEFFRRTMTDEHELLAYGMTSPTFRQWAQKLDSTGRFIKEAPAAAPTPAPRLTLWQRFVDAARSLVGLSKLYEPRINALMQQSGLQFQTADTPPTLATRLDALLKQTLALKVGPAEYAGDWTPGRDTKLNLQAGTGSFQSVRDSMTQENARNAFLDAVTSHKSTNIWQRTIGTQYAKAESNPTTYKPVFDAIQSYIKDTSVFANAAADQAPGILPKMNDSGDALKVLKDAVSGQSKEHRANIQAAGNAAFEGTLKWSRDENGQLVDNDDAIAKAASLTSDQKARVLFKAGLVTEAELKRWQATPLDIYDGAVRNRYEQKLLRPGVVFKDDELRSLFKLSDKQIGLYREFRAAADQSLDDMGRSELVRLAGQTGAAVAEQAIGADSMQEAAAILSEHIDGLTQAETSAAKRDSLTELRNSINDKANRVAQLKSEGYAPLMRFGEHTLHVTGADGETQFFGMYESGMAANKAARGMQAEFPRSTVTQGVMSKEAYKLYQGMDLNSLELFAESTGNADNQVYQDFLRLTKNNRSALKRLINRKGIAGYSDNASRVLASFVTSNARMASGNLHMGNAIRAADAIPKEMGDLKDEATRLVKYVQSPGNEAPAVRALLFTNFIGGSIASAAVNLTQPFTMSLPYLSQFGGAVKAGRSLIAAAKMAAGGKATGEIGEALARAEADGIVSPQEIHHLQSAAQDRLSNHPALKALSFIWGSMFSLSEQFNRRVTFIAAYNTAKDQGIANPFAFAEKSVIETQGLYNKGNKPNFARGPIGATLMTFKQFSIHYLEFLTRMWNNGPEGKKAVGTALALMLMTAGAGGLPFADDLDDLIDTLAQALGYDFSSKRAKREFIESQMGETAAQFLTRGITGLAGMPIDVSARMGMGNLIPGTGLFLRSKTDHTSDVLEFAGAAGGLAKSAVQSGNQVLQGDFTQAAMGMMPLAIQNMAKAAEMFNTGEYRNSRGQLVTNVSPMDAAVKAIGFQPGDVAQETARRGEVLTSIQLAKNVTSEIASKWAQGINENRPDLVSEARDQLKQWNADNGNEIHLTMQSIINRVREMRETANQRLTKMAPRPMRADVAGELQ